MSRDEWISIFEAAVSKPPEEMNDEWAWLLRELKLPLTSFAAVIVALDEGRWRNANDPKAYVKTVARRLENKWDADCEKKQPKWVDISAALPGESANFQQAMDRLEFSSESSSPTKGSNGRWRGGGGGDYGDREDPRNVYGSYRGFLMKDLPSELLNSTPPSQEYQECIEEANRSTKEFHIHLHSRVEPKWADWCQSAGFDHWETLVVTCKTSGVSRERAIANQPDDVSRKALQAAWKRFDRTGGDRLKAALKKFPKRDVPEYEF